MQIKEAYVLAMRERAPRMLNELGRSGALQAHLQAKAVEASEMFDRITANLPKFQNGIVQDTAARHEAERQVLAALIEFPSRSQPDVGGGTMPQPPREDEGDAIRAFAKVRFLAMAEELAVDLRSRRATDIYGDDIGAQSIWDEYCYETQMGPTFELTEAWSSLLDPLVADLIDRTLHEEAVLLTIAEEWHIESDDPQDSESEPYSNPDLIAQAVLLQLHNLAKNSDWDGHEPDDECYTCWDEEPYCVLPLGESNRRSLFATLRRLWAAIRNF